MVNYKIMYKDELLLYFKFMLNYESELIYKIKLSIPKFFFNNTFITPFIIKWR